MAKNKNKEAAEAVATEAAAISDEKPAKGSNRLFTLVLIPLILIPAAGGAWLAYKQYPLLLSAATVLGAGSEKAHAEGEEAAKEEEEKAEGGEEGEEGHKSATEFGEFFEIQNIIINPAATGGQRFLVVSIGLESAEPKALEEAKAKEIVIRDHVLRLLGERTVDQLANLGERNRIKEEILQGVNGMLAEGKISRMYFTQYVLQ